MATAARYRSFITDERTAEAINTAGLFMEIVYGKEVVRIAAKGKLRKLDPGQCWCMEGSSQEAG